MRNIIPFNTKWLFSATAKNQEKVFADTVITLPFFHSIETMPVCTFSNSWTPAENEEGKTVYLEFTQLTGKTEIYLNGNLIAAEDSHRFSFRVLLTNEADPHTEYKIELKVIPEGRIDGLFAFAGVSIITTDSSHFNLSVPGDGLYITSSVKNGKGEVNVSTEVIKPNNYDIVSYTVLNSSGYEVASATSKPTSPAAKITIDIPDLWEGQGGACVYTLRASLRRDSAVLDETSSEFGIRDFSVDDEGFFRLNGFRLPLDGAELTDCSAVRSDTENLRHLDGNALMSSMLPTKTNLLSYCDKAGSAFWYCPPYSADADRDTRALKEFLIIYRNHPSLIFLVCPENADTYYTEKFIKTAREYAPGILIAARRNIENATENIPDNISLILLDIPCKTQADAYITFSGRFRDLQEKYPDKHFAVFAQSPARSESGMKDNAEHHIRLWQTFCRQKGMIAYFCGLLTDEKNGDGRRGLISNDRSEVYDAFWFYKAQFSSGGFIKIIDPDIYETEEKLTDLRCTTNRTNLRLLVNGKDKKYKAEKLTDGLFIFRQIKLKPGLNTFEVSADDECDSIEIVRI